MQPANLVQLAKTGSAQAIAALIARQLKPQGIRVQADLDPDALHLRFTAAQPPKAERLIPWLYRGLTALQPQGIDCVRLSGWRLGAEEPHWQFELRLSAPLPPLDSLRPAAIAASPEPVDLPDPPSPPPEPAAPPPAPLATWSRPSPSALALLASTTLFVVLVYRTVGLTVLAVLAVLGGMVAIAAAAKQRCAWTWFCYGLLVFPVAILHVASLDSFSWYGLVLFVLGLPFSVSLVGLLSPDNLWLLALLAAIPAGLARSRGRNFFPWYLYGLGAFFVATLHAVQLPKLGTPRWAGQDCRDRSFAGQDLTGANFAGANLAGVDLSGAVLLHAQCQRANLRGANLQGALLWGADFQTADLTDAKLIDVQGHWQGVLRRPPRWLLWGAGAVLLQAIAWYYLSPYLLLFSLYQFAFVTATLAGLAWLEHRQPKRVRLAIALLGVGGALLLGLWLLLLASLQPLLLISAFPVLLLAIAGMVASAILAIAAWEQRHLPQLGLWLGALGGAGAVPLWLPLTSIRTGETWAQTLLVLVAVGLSVGWLVGLGSTRCRLSFRQANLRRTDFTGARLQGADFRQAIATGVKLTNADLRGAISPQGTVFRNHKRERSSR